MSIFGHRSGMKISHILLEVHSKSKLHKISSLLDYTLNVNGIENRKQIVQVTNYIKMYNQIENTNYSSYLKSYIPHNHYRPGSQPVRLFKEQVN